MSRDVPYEIADTMFVVEQIGRGYTNAVSALKEYITNCVDEYTKSRILGSPIRHPTIAVNINRDDHCITIQDFALGMSPGFLEQLPASIAKGFKRGNPDMRGEKAMGMHAWRSIGERAIILTRTHESNGSYACLRMENGKDKAIFELLDERIVERDLGPGFAQGTRVAIYGIQPSVLNKSFTLAGLQRALGQVYDPILREKEVIIQVGLDGSWKTIQPVARNGEIVLEDKVIVEFRKQGEFINGRFAIMLWLNPDGVSEKIGCYSKGVYLTDLCSMEEFDDFPWNSGKLSGFVDDNFCRPVQNREGYDKNTKAFEELVRILELYQPRVEEIVRRAEQEQEETKAQGIVQQLMAMFGKAYTQNPFTLGIRGPKGPPNGGSGGSGGGNGGARKGIPYAINIGEFGADEAHLRSTLGSIDDILINEGHPDYQRLVQGRPKGCKEAIQYLIALIAREAALADCSRGMKAQGKRLFPLGEDDSRAVQERAMALQLAVLQQIGIIKT
ncbi:ATP-binding protein [Candidatus Woesearchaeota archaeon]|nr:ATP-binding protein [Candidatus Woesearchaeota archaeon]